MEQVKYVGGEVRQNHKSKRLWRGEGEGPITPFCNLSMHDDLTFKNGSPGVIEFCLQEVGIFGWDNGVVGKSPMLGSFTIAKLVQILTDVLQIWTNIIKT